MAVPEPQHFVLFEVRGKALSGEPLMELCGTHVQPGFISHRAYGAVVLKCRGAGAGLALRCPSAVLSPALDKLFPACRLVQASPPCPASRISLLQMIERFLAPISLRNALLMLLFR